MIGLPSLSLVTSNYRSTSYRAHGRGMIDSTATLATCYVLLTDLEALFFFSRFEQHSTLVRTIIPKQQIKWLD
jgi:hypothetical protein